MSVRIGVACEDNGHFRVCTRIIDASLLQALPWLDGVFEVCRAYCGVDPDSQWSKLADLKQRSLIRSRRLHGFIAGQPLEPEARMWRKVLSHFEEMSPRPEAVLLIRDLDGYPDRLKGLQQVREHLDWPFPIVAATPQPEIEAWQIAAWEPTGAEEAAFQLTLDTPLGFDPRTDSHRLTSHPNDAPTDAKHIWEIIRGIRNGEPDDSWEPADLARLHERGRGNYLAGFLAEIDAHLVPVFRRPT